jgi:hypothetical protein
MLAGSSDKHEFQAETRMLLDIVAKSLYSEKEVSKVHWPLPTRLCMPPNAGMALHAPAVCVLSTI